MFTANPSKEQDFIPKSGITAALIRNFDWSKTPLGSIENWPISLKSAINICLNCAFPASVFCGSESILIYNDAFIPIAGRKHPDGIFGLFAQKGRSEIWHFLSPLIKKVLETQETIQIRDNLELLDCSGFLEERYISSSFSPIGSDGDICAVFHILFDNTHRIINERQSKILSALNAHSAKAKTVKEVCEIIIKMLEENKVDIPFALLYLLNQQHNQAILQGTIRLEPGTKIEDTIISPVTLSLDESVETNSIWPIKRIIKDKKIEIIDVSKFPALPSGQWNMSPKKAILMPLLGQNQEYPIGFFISGISPVRALDQNYLNFYTLMSSLISSTIINAFSYEKEQENVKKLVILKQELETEVTTRTRELQEANDFLKNKNIHLEETKNLLKKSEGNYRILTDISPSGIYRRNEEGLYYFINQKICEITGLNESELKKDGWQSVHPEDKDYVIKAWQKFIQKRLHHFKEQYRFLKPTGVTVWVIDEAISEEDEDRHIKGYVGTLTDISELKMLEKIRNQEAESYRKQQEQFIDSMCHELRNPLNGIYGNISLLQDNIARLEKALLLKNMPKESHFIIDEASRHIRQDKESVDAIDTCAKHQKNIVDDVLTLSKLTAGKVELNLVDFDPKKVIQDATEMLAVACNKKHLELCLKVTQKNIFVKGDPNRLLQVLLNLLSNAIKFSKEAGKIIIGLSQTELSETYTLLEFTIEDFGVGMSNEEKNRIFNRFEQASARTSQEYGGSGLGLFISQNLAELMDGTIGVESEKNRGSKFTFTIKCKNVLKLRKEPSPIIFSSPSPSPSPSPSIAPTLLSPVRKRILIVEDNLINQKLLKKILEKAGHFCSIANNGKEAVETWEQQKESNALDIILMDIEMPIMNGLEATKIIRQKEQAIKSDHPTVIVGLSGNARQEKIELAKAQGMNDYLTKPVHKDELLQTLKVPFPRKNSCTLEEKNKLTTSPHLLYAYSSNEAIKRKAETLLEILDNLLSGQALHRLQLKEHYQQYDVYFIVKLGTEIILESQLKVYHEEFKIEFYYNIGAPGTEFWLLTEDKKYKPLFVEQMLNQSPAKQQRA